MLQLRRGGLALCDAKGLVTPALYAMVQRHVPHAALRAKECRDGPGCQHITVAVHEEWRQILQSSAETAENLLRKSRSEMANLSGIRVKGLGSASNGSNRCWYLVVEWPAAARWRAQHGLLPHDFHMTMGFLRVDVHGVTKDETTLIEHALAFEADPEPEPEPELQDDSQLMIPILDELVNQTTLRRYLEEDYQCKSGPDPSDPVQMRGLLKSYRANTICRAQMYTGASSGDSRALQRLRAATAGSADAKTLTRALKHTIQTWATAAVVQPNDAGASGGDGSSLVRTLSAQAKQQAELARKDQQAAENEEAAVATELAEAKRELDRYRQLGQKTMWERGGAGKCESRGATTKKKLICIRHGKSLAQGVPNRRRKTDHEYLDAKLASSGRQQALDLALCLQKSVHHLEDPSVGKIPSEEITWMSLIQRAELVVVSPLTRALETACLIFSGIEDPVPTGQSFVCHPAVAEIGGIPENQARSVAELRKDKDLADLPHFSNVEFSLLEAESKWPPSKGTNKRSRKAAVDKFMAWLGGRPEEVIVLVSHHNFLQGLLNTTDHIENCSPVVLQVCQGCEVA